MALCSEVIPMGDLNNAHQVRHAITSVLKRARRNLRLDRGEIAAQMSRPLGRQITDPILNAWAAESKGSWRLPFDAAHALCAVTQDWNLFDVLLKSTQKRLANANEISADRLCEISLQIKALRLERRDLERSLERELRRHGLTTGVDNESKITG